jgi:hypothetical protein
MRPLFYHHHEGNYTASCGAYYGMSHKRVLMNNSTIRETAPRGKETG